MDFFFFFFFGRQVCWKDHLVSICHAVCMDGCTDVCVYKISSTSKGINLHSLMRTQWPIFVKLGMWVVGRAVANLTVPGGQEFHFPHFFLKVWSIFPQTLLILFLILALRVGESLDWLIDWLIDWWGWAHWWMDWLIDGRIDWLIIDWHFCKRPIPASRLWPKKVDNFTFEWLQLLMQTCYQQVFDWE